MAVRHLNASLAPHLETIEPKVFSTFSARKRKKINEAESNQSILGSPVYLCGFFELHFAPSDPQGFVSWKIL